MKRKLSLLLVSLLALSLALSACGQKEKGIVLAIGEEKGKAAGLALINLAFDVNEELKQAWSIRHARRRLLRMEPLGKQSLWSPTESMSSKRLRKMAKPNTTMRKWMR